MLGVLQPPLCAWIGSNREHVGYEPVIAACHGKLFAA